MRMQGGRHLEGPLRALSVVLWAFYFVDVAWSEPPGPQCVLNGCQALSAMKRELWDALREDLLPLDKGQDEPLALRKGSRGQGGGGILGPIRGASFGHEDFGTMEALSAAVHSRKQIMQLADKLSSLERRVRSLEQPVWSLSSRRHLEWRSRRMEGPVDEWTRCTEGPCRCRPETRTLSCWRQGLGELPPTQFIPEDTKTIDLGVNHLTALHSDSFKGLVHLMELRLHRNSLEELPSKLFRHQLNLATLDISSNNLIRVAPELFHPLRRELVFLSLSQNRISEIPEGAISGFEKLEELDLSGNALSTLPPLRGLPSLRRLRIHRNRLRELPADVFRDVPNLELLTLRGNRLTVLPKGLFAGLTKLKHLELASNWITSIDDSDFCDLVSLKELHLSQNFLESLPGHAFSRPDAYSSMERLFLFSNNLEVLESSALAGLHNLSTLMLNNNLLRKIGDTAFENTPNLRKLQLDSNKFHFLPTRLFDPLTKLVSVKLAKNPWHCDCSILYLATWLRENKRKVWDSPATCRGPGDLGGHRVEEMTFDDLCEGQWASLVSLQPRVPVFTKSMTKQEESEEDDKKSVGKKSSLFA
ncbi:leucine-rich repeat-containing protein 15-like isoform X2 [Ischnura elegans]|uniref:leucine-rich repeat-containing protein 15-like isoform X2 n=1 Tax=Ischnura elegans TaxID=197161 RepID=UPI001ED87108|nr:leucine-rich repeat-containing protein 15-like isoform X2 [Ischnura elegans]